MPGIGDYEAFLRELGFRPQRTQGGDLRFKYEGRTYSLTIYDDDPSFFQLLFPGIWTIDTPDELREALDVCNLLTLGRKVSKVYVDQDRSQVSASLELFVPDMRAVRSVFMRALSSLEGAGRELRDQLGAGRVERSAAQLRALVRRRLFEVLTDNDTDAVTVLFADDYECVDPAMPPGGWPAGPVAAMALAAAYHGAFETFQLTVHQQHVAGSVVTTRWSLTGHQSGPLLGLPACREEVTLEAISIDELREAQIIRTVTSYDCAQIARALLAPRAAPARDELPAESQVGEG